MNGLRFKPEPEAIAKINRELSAKAMDRGVSNHFRVDYTNRCACGLVFDDVNLLAQHATAANAADQARGDGRQKYGLIEIGGCKVSVRFDFDGNLVINAHVRGSGFAVPVKFATDADSLSIAP